MSDLTQLWENFSQVAETSRAIVAQCKRIHSDEYGPNVGEIHPAVIKTFGSLVGHQDWFNYRYTLLSLFARGLYHEKGVSLGIAIRNMKTGNEKQEGKERRFTALLSRSNKHTFLQALGRLMSLSKEGRLGVDLDVLDRDLRTLFDFQNSQVKLHWMRDFFNTNSN